MRYIIDVEMLAVEICLFQVCYVMELAKVSKTPDSSVVLSGSVNYDKKHQRVLEYDVGVEIIGSSVLDGVGALPVFVWTIVLTR